MKNGAIVSRLWLGLCGLLLSSLALSAQVTVEVEFPQEQFLAGEPIPMAVKLKNLSGQSLRLGESDDWLTFLVERSGGSPARELGPVPVRGTFTVDSASVATHRSDLEPYYELTRNGRYKVTAYVKIPGWDKPLVSKSIPFDIVSGHKVWEQVFGVPGPVVDAPPLLRKYTLVQATYLKQLRLYLRVTEGPDDELQKLVILGPMTSFAKPECQLDKFNNLHVLHQTGAKIFSYYVVTPEGDTLARQTHQYIDSRPTLKPGKEGQIQVVGGTRWVTAADVPPPATTSKRDAQK